MDRRAIAAAAASFALAWLVVWVGLRMGDGRRVLLGGTMLLLVSVVFLVSGAGQQRNG